MQASDSQYTETESRIFHAALQVFARKGRDGARMQEIADLAGINKAMLHYYFRSKDRLYEEVFLFVFRHLMQSFGAAMAEAPTFADLLRAFIDGYVDFIRAHQAVARIMVSEMLAGGPALQRGARQVFGSGEAVAPLLFLRRVEEAGERGEIRKVDPVQTLLTIIGASVIYFVAHPLIAVIHPGAADEASFLEARKAHLFDLIYHGLKPLPAAQVS